MPTKTDTCACYDIYKELRSNSDFYREDIIAFIHQHIRTLLAAGVNPTELARQLGPIEVLQHYKLLKRVGADIDINRIAKQMHLKDLADYRKVLLQLGADPDVIVRRASEYFTFDEMVELGVSPRFILHVSNEERIVEHLDFFLNNGITPEEIIKRHPGIFTSEQLVQLNVNPKVAIGQARTLRDIEGLFEAGFDSTTFLRYKVVGAARSAWIVERPRDLYNYAKDKAEFKQVYLESLEDFFKSYKLSIEDEIELYRTLIDLDIMNYDTALQRLMRRPRYKAHPRQL